MVFKKKFKVQSNHRAVSFHDVTDEVKAAVAESKIQNGIVVVYSHHTTCSVITQDSDVQIRGNVPAPRKKGA